MEVGVAEMTLSSISTLCRWCLIVTLFLPSTLLLVSVMSTDRSGLPLTIATSVTDGYPGAHRDPGGEVAKIPSEGSVEQKKEEVEGLGTVASGPSLSRKDTAGQNGFADSVGAGVESVGTGGEVACSSGGNSLDECQEAQRVRSRPRRSLAFPEGSKASLRVNIKYVLFNTSNWLAYANGFRTGWDLPKNGTVALPFARSIQRREIFRDIEEIMVYHGMDGRACILRGLCEATKSISARSGIIRRLLHLLFTIPEDEEHHMEEYRPEESGWKRRYSEEVNDSESSDCDSIFSSCPFSLLDLTSLDFS